MRGHYSVEQCENYAKNYDIPLEIREEIVKPGWAGANKGFMQVLWERGLLMIGKETNIHKKERKVGETMRVK